MLASMLKLFKEAAIEPSLDELDLAVSEGSVAWHNNLECKYPPGPLRDAWREGKINAKMRDNKF